MYKNYVTTPVKVSGSGLPIIVTDKVRLYVEQDGTGVKVTAVDNAGKTTGTVQNPDITMTAVIDDLSSTEPSVKIVKTIEEDNTINFDLIFSGIAPNIAQIEKAINAVIGGASEEFNTLGKIEQKFASVATMQALSAEILRATTTENDLRNQISTKANAEDLIAEINRAQDAESGLQLAISHEVTRAEQAESDLQYQIDNIDLSGYATTDYVDTIKGELQADIDTKQGILTAGTGISIDENNIISNTQTSAEWGNIQGTLADQTDLQTALDDKASIDYVDTKIEDLGAVLVFKGSVATYADLPAEDNNPGDVYFVQADESEYVYIENSGWEKLGPIVDLSAKADIDSPEFTGIPTTPNITDESPDDQIINKAYADYLISDTSEEALEDLIESGFISLIEDSDDAVMVDNSNNIYIED